MNLPPDLVEGLLTRCSARILESHNFESADKSSLFSLNRLIETYLNTLIARTISFARTNKRNKVNDDDVELSLFMESISLSALEAEWRRLRGGEAGDPSLELSTAAEKVARGFESTDKKLQAQLLGPELQGRARGVPDYMEKGMMLPNLPPLYTHYRSPIFVERETGELDIRERVTEQSKLVERSLRDLIELEERTAIDNHTRKGESAVSDDEGDTLDDRVTNVMMSTVPERERRRRAREEMFAKVWKDMGFGEVAKGKFVNWETATTGGNEAIHATT